METAWDIKYRTENNNVFSSLMKDGNEGISTLKNFRYFVFSSLMKDGNCLITLYFLLYSIGF